MSGLTGPSSEAGRRRGAGERPGEKVMAMDEKRRQFLKACAGGLLAACGARALARDGQRPNIVYIMTDQQPVCTIGAYGNAVVRTPNLDRLAREGMRLNRFFIAGFPCSPSRASMLSGRYPHQHGVVRNDVLFDPAVPCLGDVLNAAGYDTAYFGKWHLGGHMYRNIKGRKPFEGAWYYRRLPSDQGFAFEAVRGGLGEDAPQHGFQTWAGGWKQYKAYLRRVGLGELVDKYPNLGNHNDLPSAPEGKHMYSQLPEEHHMAAFFAKEAEKFIRSRRGSGRPFGLVLSFYGPHLPVAPPKPWDEMYSLEQAALPANHRDTLEGKPLGQRRNTRCYKLPAWREEQFRDYIRRYWGYCSYIDKQIGRVLAALDECGFAENTIVVFTSDHGDMIAAHGMIFKLGKCAYEELMRVPCIIRAPGVTAPGSVSDALVSNVDFLPTFCELLGIAPPPGMAGRSFADVLRGKRKTFRDAVFCDIMEQTLMVRTERWKFVLNWNKRDLDELYDLDNDPGELRNLAQEAKYKNVVREMLGRIADWLRETEHPYAEVIMNAAKKPPEVRLVDVWPEVSEFQYLGGRAFKMTILWHAEQALDGKYWSFTQFINPRYGKDGAIAFRFTPWPDPPTTEWKAGGVYRIDSGRVEVPAHCGPGEYEVRIGLYDPQRKKGPGILKRGTSNYLVVGKLRIEGKEGKITKITFVPREK